MHKVKESGTITKVLPNPVKGTVDYAPGSDYGIFRALDVVSVKIDDVWFSYGHVVNICL